MNKDTLLFIFMKEEQEMLQCTEGSQCGMGTVLYHNRVAMNGMRDSKMVEQASSMRKEHNQLLKETVHAWLVSQPKMFYSKGMMDQVNRKARGSC
jgi:hypothetical protein